MMEAALDVDAAPLLAMQNEYDMLMAERNESFMEKAYSSYRCSFLSTFLFETACEGYLKKVAIILYWDSRHLFCDKL